MKLYDFMRLARVRRQASRARRHARAQGSPESDQLAELQAALERATAVNVALGELLVGKGTLSAEELEAKLVDLELRDPTFEGLPEGQACQACGRKNRGERAACFFCGELVRLAEDAKP